MKGQQWLLWAQQHQARLKVHDLTCLNTAPPDAGAQLQAAPTRGTTTGQPQKIKPAL